MPGKSWLSVTCHHLADPAPGSYRESLFREIGSSLLVLRPGNTRCTLSAVRIRSKANVVSDALAALLINVNGTHYSGIR